MTYTVVHMFSGSGGCSRGFQLEDFKTIAAFDNDADACADLDYLLGERVAVCIDIAAMTTADLRRWVGEEAPDVMVLTPPCKAWSKCLPKKKRYSPKYQAMTRLAPRAVRLALGAWETPPKLIVIENVRGMNTEGRELMEEIQQDLRRHGYVWNIRTWNLGEFGLAQNRDRCLFVARHEPQVPCFLMVPPRSRPRPCGDDLGKLPPPIMDKRSDSMHKLPQLSALNWLRLAAIPPGKDWKALPARIRLGGQGRARHDGKFGVEDPAKPAHTVTARNRVVSGWGAVAWSSVSPRSGVIVADARLGVDPRKEWAHDTHGGRPHNYGVQPWDAPASTIKGKQVVQNSRAAVAHPAYPTPTHRLVRDADGEIVLVGPPIKDWDEVCYLVIKSEDGSWHRPLTDLELAVLQSLPAYHRGEMLALRGPSGKRREHIGNMLPTLAAQAIARECRETLDARGDGFRLVGSGDVLVRQPAHGGARA